MLGIDEPVPEEVALLVNLTKDSLLEATDLYLIDQASRSLYPLDSAYFSDLLPSSTDLLDLIFRCDTEIPKDNGLFGLLKTMVDREISDMPRSMFLGTGSNESKTDKEDSLNADAIDLVLRKIDTDYSKYPFMLEAYLLSKTYQFNNNPEVITIDAFLEILNIPSLTQLHWNTRLNIPNALIGLLQVGLFHLQSSGHLGSILEQLKKRISLNLTSTSPSVLAAAILSRTCLEISRSRLSHDQTACELWAKELSCTVTRSEEVQTCILQSLNILALHGSDLKLPSISGTKLIESFIYESSSDINPSTPIEAIVSKNALHPDLKPFVEKASLSTADIQTIQIAVIGAAKETNNLELIDTFIKLHPKMVIGEPADMKGLFSIHASRYATKLTYEKAAVWVNYLINKLERPAPAIIKIDACMALNTMLFESRSNNFISLTCRFFLSSLPTLISATTDSKLNSYFFLLMVKFLLNNSDKSSLKLKSGNRFPKGSSMELIISTLESTHLNHRSVNMFTLLSTLKILPRYNWANILNLHPIALTGHFVVSHVVSSLPNGGKYVCPHLLSTLRTNLVGFNFDQKKLLIESFTKIIPYLEKSEQSSTLIELVMETYKVDLAETYRQVNRLLECGLEKSAELTEVLTSIIPNAEGPLDGWRSAYLEASKIILDIPIMRLYKDHEDLKALSGLLPDCVDFVELFALELSDLSESKQCDWLVKLLDTAVIYPDISEALRKLFVCCICFWLDKFTRTTLCSVDSLPYFRKEVICEFSVDSFACSIWKSYEDQMQLEDVQRVTKRMIPIGWILT